MPLNTNLVLPTALGFSLVAVTAVVLYYVFKKDEEETSSSRIKTAKVNVIEVSVPKKIVPALIGRSGSNVKEIEKKTGVLIHFKKFSDKDYDVCIIRGRSEATQLAETLVHEFIKQQPIVLDEQIMVPNWACGRIIGTGGDTINDISHRSGARVKLEGLPMSDQGAQRQINVKGTREQIDMATKLIENCVAQERCRREIDQSKRNPRHIHSSSSSPVPPAGSHPGDSPQHLNGSTSLASGEAAKDAGDVTHVRSKRNEAGGSSIEVYVSAVSSPSRFWVQLVGPQVAQLDDLVNQMTEYYNNKDNRELHQLKQVSVGQVVAAVFRHDSRWYRARVHDIRPNEFDSTQQVADVFFVDYGDSEYVATHELCELRADLLRLRFQAMECFLAGVRPVGEEEKEGEGWPKWHPNAVDRFEDLAQVARWKPLISRTCTYKKTVTVEGEKEKEIPGIKLFDVTEEGEIDIGASLVLEGYAVSVVTTPRTTPPRQTPFGDLGSSRVLDMLMGGNERASSLPKDHVDDRIERDASSQDKTFKDNEKIISSKSLGSGLEDSDKLLSANLEATAPRSAHPSSDQNGTHPDFLTAEKSNLERESCSTETLTGSPVLTKALREECKANMNRIDSHHGNLEALGRTHELQK